MSRHRVLLYWLRNRASSGCGRCFGICFGFLGGLLLSWDVSSVFDCMWVFGIGFVRCFVLCGLGRVVFLPASKQRGGGLCRIRGCEV